MTSTYSTVPCPAASLTSGMHESRGPRIVWFLQNGRKQVPHPDLLGQQPSEPADVAGDVRPAALEAGGVADGVAARRRVLQEPDRVAGGHGADEPALLDVGVYLGLRETLVVQHQGGVELHPAQRLGGAL